MTSVPLISIVDDDDSVRLATGELVETLGYEVETFASGEAFLGSQLVATTRCVITDVQMRGMSGPQLHEHLLNSGMAIPVIFITAFPLDRIRDQVMKRGAVAYLSKPFNRATLERPLQRALGDAQAF